MQKGWFSIWTLFKLIFYEDNHSCLYIIKITHASIVIAVHDDIDASIENSEEF